MDGISSIILASAFGIGVLFSVFPMLIFQGGITILVFYYKEFLPVELIDHVRYKKINPTNMPIYSWWCINNSNWIKNIRL